MPTHRRHRRGARTGALAVVLAVTAACTGDDGGPPAGPEDTLVVGLAEEPAVLDGAVLTEPGALRVVRQVYEGLVRTEPGSTALEPALATSWDVSDDATRYTFSLREDVTFHDGTPFDAAAVCYNVDRWYHFSGVLASPALSGTWQQVLGGFAPADEAGPSTASAGTRSRYVSCEERDEHEVVVTLSEPTPTFLAALAHPSFSFASPTALKRYDADAVQGSAVRPEFTGTFGTAHPAGTGPFRLRSWARGERIVLDRNDDYWGEEAPLRRLVFRVIPGADARRRALTAGEVDVADRVAPAALSSVRGDGVRVQRRPPFSVVSLAFDTSTPPMDDPAAREAVAHAVDREGLVSAVYPPSARVAREFVPPVARGYEPEVATDAHDPEEARRLLAEAEADTGAGSDEGGSDGSGDGTGGGGGPGSAGTPLTLWYPRDGVPVDLPEPRRVARRVADDLARVGLAVELRAASQSELADAVRRGDAPLHLAVRTAPVADGYPFLGPPLRGGEPGAEPGPDDGGAADAPDPRQAQPGAGGTRVAGAEWVDPAWSPAGESLPDDLAELVATPGLESRDAGYGALNARLMETLPGLPLVYPTTSVALSGDVEDFAPGPLGMESFSSVSVGG
jgi:peptide/nickel transport system substrate-binding protein